VGSPGLWLSQVYSRRSKETEGIDRFGAHVAHLSYRDPPTSDLARGWPVMQVAHDLGLAVARFVLNVDSSLVRPNFKTNAWREIPVSARLDRTLLPLATWTRPATRRDPR
jgi:hypothetical protein